MQSSIAVIKTTPYQDPHSDERKAVQDRIQHILNTEAIAIVLADLEYKCEVTIELLESPTRELKDLIEIAALKYANVIDTFPCIRIYTRTITVECYNIKSAKKLAESIYATFTEYNSNRLQIGVNQGECVRYS